MISRPGIIFLFLDGVGIGRKDSRLNPFFAGEYPALSEIFGDIIPHVRSGGRNKIHLSVVPVDATLGVPGLPQSGTGQAALLTGLNAPRIVGRHFGPYLYSSLKPVVREMNIFKFLKDAGKKICYANAFPRKYFEHINKGGKMSAITYAWLSTGSRLLGEEALTGGKGISADLTNERWKTLGHPEMPLISPREAGIRLADLASEHDFVFFEYFFTDHAGHTKSMEEAVRILKNIDLFAGGLLDAGNYSETVLVLTSDHGNLEDTGTGSHTRNRVPLAVYGKGHNRITSGVRRLTDIAPAIKKFMT